MFPADTDDCQRRTAGAVMVHWANPQLSLLFASGFRLQAPPPKEGKKNVRIEGKYYSEMYNCNAGVVDFKCSFLFD